jgi:hypothetical protein
VGLVAFRDKGDDYVTRVVDLDGDLDSIYTELHALQAGGGGDAPESVNQALDDAVNRIHWSESRHTLRIIFLVGDAPPHMDYPDDVKYPVTCKKAVEKGILINTIQCGNDSECRRYWKDIAAKSNGAYVAIAQAGGVVTVSTEFDARMAGRQLWDTALVYGDDAQKRRGRAMIESARRLTGPSAADRAAFAAKSKRLGPYDLLDAIEAGRVKLEEVRQEELPEALVTRKTLQERRSLLEETTARRKRLYADILELEKKRAAHIEAEMVRRKLGKDGFDAQVLGLLRKQAVKFDITY